MAKEPPWVIHLPDKFSDPDDDVLRYTAVSSNTGIATESVSGSALTITPVGKGQVDPIIRTAVRLK